MHAVIDGKYGSFDPDNKTWDGMIGEVKEWEVNIRTTSQCNT